MKYSLVILAGLARLAVASCNADNCYRVVAGTVNGTPVQSSRIADCKSWMTATVTPATSTITITASTTATTYLPPVRPRHKRKVSAAAVITSIPSVPNYVLSSCTANPTPVTARWSSACSCAGITAGITTLPTPITTTTVTATSTVNLPMCTNYGLQFAAYPLPNAYNFDPTQYKPQTPEVSGVTTDLKFSNYGSWNVPTSLYGTTPVDTSKIVVTYRGYLVVPQDGTYTFSGVVDDFLSIWLGPTATSGWNLLNAGITASSPSAYYDYGNSGPGFTLADNYYSTYTTTLSKGLVPIRLMWANGGGPGAFGVTITAPDSTILVSPSTGAGNNLITDCATDGAPAYPAFGSET